MEEESPDQNKKTKKKSILELMVVTVYAFEFKLQKELFVHLTRQ